VPLGVGGGHSEYGFRRHRDAEVHGGVPRATVDGSHLGP
jgi:hypothetical protein